MSGLPCRVAGDLRRHQAEQADVIAERFDEYLEEHVGAAVPIELVKPVMHLLQTRRAIETLERTEGFDKASVLDALRPELDALYTACMLRWRDQ